MYIYKKVTVAPDFPERIKRLNGFAYNLWWSWNSHALKLFEFIDAALWIECQQNPVFFLKQVSNTSLINAAQNQEYLQLYDTVMQEFDTYINNSNTWFALNLPDKKAEIIAYFCAEFGLHESLPIYSGGLGILAGDHCKSASDLGLPFVAIGLFYKQGYFVQHLNAEGLQESKFMKLDTAKLPIQQSKDKNGNDITIPIDFPGRVVYVKVWEVHVGRIKIYMLDTDIPDNYPTDRAITSVLYGGDQEMRISQEIVLGIGGIKMLKTMGIKPSIYHLNEGHSAFCTIELMLDLIENNRLSYESALEVVAASTIFTTHTPVPAGSDRFPLYLMDKYFSQIWSRLKINRNQFMCLGISGDAPDIFNMTVLALKMAGQKNGVSKLHGIVSRNIFNTLWPNIPEQDVPISSVTNGIHTTTWLNPAFTELFNKYLGENWIDKISDESMWENIDNIPDSDLWNAHLQNKRAMIDYIRKRLITQKIRNGESQKEINVINTLLDANVLTIGFARRFATYKRAALIFRNLAKIREIINKPDMPVQLIFAGKAHPADNPAQEFIKQIHDIARNEGFKGKVFLIENYDMKLSRYLTSGVDIWLNNPRRPLEASGTSGQKAALNGVINFSVLDGWWAEGYNQYNGWAIGNQDYYESAELQDNADAYSLYNILENQIIPLYYSKDESGLPSDWLKVMRESIKSCAPVFSTTRMVQEYTAKLYATAIDKQKNIMQNNYTTAKELSQWKLDIAQKWHTVRIEPDHNDDNAIDDKVNTGQPFNLTVPVYLGSINPSEVRIEAYFGEIEPDNTIAKPEAVPLSLEGNCGDCIYRYSGSICFDKGGEYGYTFRALPFHPDLINIFDLGLITWMEENK